MLFFVFTITTISFYLSDVNVKKTNKHRSIYLTKAKIDLENLPLLENDTKEIIEYRDDVEVFKKNKKKYKFWDLIKDK